MLAPQTHPLALQRRSRIDLTRKPPRRASPTHPLVAHDEEEANAEARDEDQVNGAPFDDVHKKDSEDNDDEVSDEAEATRKVQLGKGGGSLT